MDPSRIQAIDHVNIEAPPELEDSLRWFYSELGTLDEVDSSHLEYPALCFKSARIEIRVHLKENPQIEATMCRVTVAVPSLEDIEAQLLERQVIHEHITGIFWMDARIGTYDPAGNRVEFKQDWPISTL